MKLILNEEEKTMNHVITVSREFGSGGRELGKRLADALGFSYYDREIVTALAEKTGLDEDYLASSTEAGAISQFPIHFARSFTQIPAVPNDAVKLMSMQTSLIKELAEKGNCVIVGRAADSILEDFAPFKIFVYADETSKLERCRNRAEEGENLSDREMLRAMKRIDKARAEFHDIISDYKWGEKEGYDLCINTTGLEIKKVIPALAEYYRHLAS